MTLLIVLLDRTTSNQILAALEGDDDNLKILVDCEPETSISVVPPKEDGVTDKDSDDSVDEITSSFGYLLKRTLNLEAK